MWSSYEFHKTGEYVFPRSRVRKQDAATRQHGYPRRRMQAQAALDTMSGYLAQSGEQIIEAHIAQKSPFALEVEAGTTYYWCACGLSKTQPFCDGSHKGGGFSPMKFEATETRKVYFCGCKQSANKPLCDGAHKAL